MAIAFFCVLRDIVNCCVWVPAFAGMTSFACWVMGNFVVKHEVLRLRAFGPSLRMTREGVFGLFEDLLTFSVWWGFSIVVRLGGKFTCIIFMSMYYISLPDRMIGQFGITNYDSPSHKAMVG